MKFFIDSAEIEEIREIASWGILSGVTTNPSLIAQSRRDFVTVIKEICDLVPGAISAEVIATEPDEMVREGIYLAELHPNVVVKLPMGEAGLVACRVLSGRQIPVNMTLVFSSPQALLAARSGARFVSPFVGRVDDIGWDGSALIAEISALFKQHKIATEVLAASIRHPAHVVASAQAGADIATVPYQVFKTMVHHPLTDIGLARFLADWEKFKNL